MLWHEQITEYWSLCISGGGDGRNLKNPSAVMLGAMLRKHLQIKGVKHPFSYVKATKWTAKKDKSLICIEGRLKGLQCERNIWLDCDASVFNTFRKHQASRAVDRECLRLFSCLTSNQRCQLPTWRCIMEVSPNKRVWWDHTSTAPLIKQSNCRLIERLKEGF